MPRQGVSALKDLTWYLSGPMAGYAGHNFAAFEETASALREQGWHIVSPHEVDPPRADAGEVDVLGLHAGRVADQVNSAYVSLQGSVELHLAPRHDPLLDQLEMTAQVEPQVETCEHHGRIWRVRTYQVAADAPADLTIRTVRSQPVPGVLP